MKLSSTIFLNLLTVSTISPNALASLGLIRLEQIDGVSQQHKSRELPVELESLFEVDAKTLLGPMDGYGSIPHWGSLSFSMPTSPPTSDVATASNEQTIGSIAGSTGDALNNLESGNEGSKGDTSNENSSVGLGPVVSGTVAVAFVSVGAALVAVLFGASRKQKSFEGCNASESSISAGSDFNDRDAVEDIEL